MLTRLRILWYRWRYRRAFRHWAEFLYRQDRAISSVERVVLDILRDR
jgi:hypothetical protein